MLGVEAMNMEAEDADENRLWVGTNPVGVPDS